MDTFEHWFRSVCQLCIGSRLLNNDLWFTLFVNQMSTLGCTTCSSSSITSAHIIAWYLVPQPMFVTFECSQNLKVFFSVFISILSLFHQVERIGGVLYPFKNYLNRVKLRLIYFVSIHGELVNSINYWLRDVQKYC